MTLQSTSRTDLLGVTGRSVQELLGGVERSDVTRDEDGLPTEIYDGGDAGSVRVKPPRILLKALRGLEQAVVLLAVKLADGRHASAFTHLQKTRRK